MQTDEDTLYIQEGKYSLCIYHCEVFQLDYEVFQLDYQLGAIVNSP